MPGRYYSIKQSKELFEIFCVDSNTIRFSDDEQQWLKDKVFSSKAKWKILVSHHPVITKGKHACEPDVTGFNDLILKNKIYKNINIFIAAHEHNNQILYYLNNSFQVIVGNCSSKRPHKIKTI